MDIIFDTEVYPNCFMFRAVSADGKHKWAVNITDSRNNGWSSLYSLIHAFKSYGYRMVGFNNLGFDYPVLHYIVTSQVKDPKQIYDYAMAVLQSEDKFKFMVWPSDRLVPQIDLFKIHHFDNKARMTSLKALEFNMRMDNISDLPFPVGSVLTDDQIQVLSDYCWHDVEATRLFYLHSKEKIDFREKLAAQYPNKDFLNFNDVKIGKEYFQIRLESAGVECYTYGPEGRTPKQTKRGAIDLAECMPRNAHFSRPEFEQMRQFFLNTTITETKNAFKETVTVDGLEFVFGTGGIHASVEAQAYRSDDTWMIYDVDVTSLYPSIAIEYDLYPEHLGPAFVKVYRDLREERLRHPKGSAENAMLKLALNGVYGVSNDPFSVFFDPLFTMRITITGQMLIAMLADRLLNVPGVRIIQANTDGITLYMRRDIKWLIDGICAEWEADTRLSLEKVEYDRMHIADVNNYVARKVDGTVKRKGRYEWETQWHQDASCLVVPKAAEKVILEDAPIRETVESWPDLHDFMLRIKVNRGSRLVLADGDADIELTDRTVRYYLTNEGLPMVKVMPPLAKKPHEYRRISVQSGYKVKPCNNITKAVLPINHDWYINEVEKLVLGVL